MQMGLQCIGLQIHKVSGFQRAAPEHSDVARGDGSDDRHASVVNDQDDMNKRVGAVRAHGRAATDTVPTTLLRTSLSEESIALLEMPEAAGCVVDTQDQHQARQDEASDGQVVDMSPMSRLDNGEGEYGFVGLAGHMHAAAMDGSASTYSSILALEVERQQLKQRAEELRAACIDDMSQSVRRIAPRYYGWMEAYPNMTTFSQMQRSLLGNLSCRRGIGASSSSSTTAMVDTDGLWKAMQDMQVLEHRPKAPNASVCLLDEMQSALMMHGLDGMDSALVKSVYPWTHASAEVAVRDRLCSRSAPSTIEKDPCPQRTPAYKSFTRPASRPPTQRQSIAQRRFQQDMAEMEAKIQHEINTKFRAKPAPTSVHVPKSEQLHFVLVARSALAMQRIPPALAQCSYGTNYGQHNYKLRKNASSANAPVISKAVSKMNSHVRNASHIHQADQHDATTCPEEVVVRVAITAGEDGRKRRERIQKSESMSGITIEHTFHPRITGDIPNYEATQRQLFHRLDTLKRQRIPIKQVLTYPTA
ncbi:hypothetical protein BSLG_009897 [Batrachochytrium salamandrivorans]|nr:hypothetical protein BSLG_009897 [Batrachochytrium salamandrivorans]